MKNVCMISEHNVLIQNKMANRGHPIKHQMSNTGNPITHKTNRK